MKTISRDQVKAKKDNDNVTVINVLGKDNYEEKHIPGSINIPLDQLEDRVDELDKDNEIIVYCASPSCQASPKAAETLSEHGFDVADYEGGMSDWEDAGEDVCDGAHKEDKEEEEEADVCRFC